MLFRNRHLKALDRPLVFITGAPRSGTSMLTKIVDAHPDIAVLMENIFQNRRRHWTKAEFWYSNTRLAEVVGQTFNKLQTPIVGNKVCTPDVWSADDIAMFCQLFSEFYILFIVRDPIAVAASRYRREDYAAAFTEMARQRCLLNFESRLLTYLSSWRQSIEAYWALRDAYFDRVMIVYYDDFVENFNRGVDRIFSFLPLDRTPEIDIWDSLPHHDSQGVLKLNLKYRDRPVNSFSKIATPFKKDDVRALLGIHYDLWKRHSL